MTGMEQDLEPPTMRLLNDPLYSAAPTIIITTIFIVITTIFISIIIVTFAVCPEHKDPVTRHDLKLVVFCWAGHLDGSQWDHSFWVGVLEHS